MKAMFSTVAYDINPVQKAAVWPGVIEEDSQWCFAKEWHYKKVIRDVYKNHGAALAKAKKLKKYVCEQFEEQKMYDKMRDAVWQEESQEVENWLSSLSVKSFE